MVYARVQYLRLYCFVFTLMISLFNQLRNLKVGCQLNCVYLGIWVNADDNKLLSPSRSGLQLMTNVCEKFASLHQLKFSTNVDVSESKTKCIVFSNPCHKY